MLIESIIFVVLSAALVYLSRASLSRPRSHGFYRFFAWEATLLLILLNINVWFNTPLAWHQLISWLLLIISIYPVVHGMYLLRAIGRPDNNRAETELMGFEKTTMLVTKGVYRYIRHPLYSSLFFLTWGVFFKDPSWWGGLLALAATIFLTATAKTEEGENIRFFGPVYQTYMQQTKMFVPFIF